MARKKTKRKSFILPLLAICAVAALVGGLYVLDNKLPAFGSSCELYVYESTTVSELEKVISSKAAPKYPSSLKRCFARENVSGKLKPGHYHIEKSSPNIYVARMLTRGWQTAVTVTLSGTIRTKEKLARQISGPLLLDSLDIATALSDNEFLAQYGFNSENVFALFLPDSYQMYWTASIENVFGRFKKEYDLFWNKERLDRAEEIGLTPMQVSVMASIVNGETNKESEYARIAGVYMNRYKVGMKLQADPTVAFCYDYKIKRVLFSHLEVDSPYNTYKYEGLPPAPINVPHKSCIDAVLNYEVHDYWYFCASSDFDGSHKFAKTLSEHSRNASDFQNALNKRK